MKRKPFRTFLAFLFLTALLLCAAAVSAGEAADTPPAEAAITLDLEEVLVGKGRSVKVTMSYDTEAFPKKPKTVWETSDKTVATVSNGTIKGVNPGTAEITCTAAFPDGAVGTKTIPVSVYTPVKSVSAKGTLTIGAGSTEVPEITIKPEDASYPNLVWTSSDENVATVDEEGSITGVAGGKATVTGTLQEPGETKQKSVRIQVTVTQSVSGVRILESSLTIPKGKSQKLTTEVQPATATNQKLTWSSSNPKVATASNGTVSAKGTGTCTITAEAADGSGATASVSVTVIQGVTGIKFQQSKVVIFKGDTYTSRATVSPQDATDKSMNWSSSNNSVASVNDSGVVTAKSTGKVTITAVARDGSERKASYTLIVEPSCPVSIYSISTYYYYWRDLNCLFVTPYNWCSTKTVKSFKFNVACYNLSGDLLHTYNCEWSGGGFKAFGPGKYGKSGSWHWYDMYYLIHDAYEKITVTSVTFTDGTVRSIPVGDRITSTFY